jgi:hypothetical protein
MKGIQNMSESTAPQTINATAIVSAFEIRTGISAKTQNPYKFGTLKIKLPSGREYSLELKYFDENADNAIEEALASLKKA